MVYNIIDDERSARTENPVTCPTTPAGGRYEYLDTAASWWQKRLKWKKRKSRHNLYYPLVESLFERLNVGFGFVDDNTCIVFPTKMSFWTEFTNVFIVRVSVSMMWTSCYYCPRNSRAWRGPIGATLMFYTALRLAFGFVRAREKI